MECVLLLYETLDGITDRLIAKGAPREAALEMANSMYADEDIAFISDKLAAECAGHDVEFHPIDVDRVPRTEIVTRITGACPKVVWCITDGGRYLKSSAVSAICRFSDVAQFGNSTYAQEVSQNKFALASLLNSMGVRVPHSWLIRNGRVVGEIQAPLLSYDGGYFVKPNTLGNKTGITDRSHALSFEAAIEVSRQLYDRYRIDAIIQEYVPGTDARIQFLNRPDPQDRDLCIGVVWFQALVGAERRFPRMADRLGIPTMALSRPFNLSTAREQGEELGDAAWRDVAAIKLALEDALALKDFWAADTRVTPEGRLVFLECEPGTGVTGQQFIAFAETTGRKWPAEFLRAFQACHTAHAAADWSSSEI